MRPDWENVVTPVMDYTLSRPEVDPGRVALIGWSFGGYLAPRAASGEHRLVACIADPGQWDMFEAIKRILPRFGISSEIVDSLPNVDPKALQPFVEAVERSPQLTWTFKQRSLWVHGLDSMTDYLRIAPQYRLSDRVNKIRCPTLIAWAENDPVASFAETLYEALTCPKTLLRFITAEGAGDHCEMNARTLSHQRAFDWLDEVLDAKKATGA